MGGSHGGSTTLATIARAPNDPPKLAEQKAHGFAAAIALYPGCDASARWATTYNPAAPLLILVGELDDWTPAAPCVTLADAAKRAGRPVTLKVYPGARHSFDSANPVRFNAARMNSHSATGRGATTGGDPDAWADSRREVSAFFARYLRPAS